MRRQVVILFVLLLVMSGCATARSAKRTDSVPRMAQVIEVGGHHCH